MASHLANPTISRRNNRGHQRSTSVTRDGIPSVGRWRLGHLNNLPPAMECV
jgi:hypothetical protein